MQAQPQQPPHPRDPPVPPPPPPAAATSNGPPLPTHWCAQVVQDAQTQPPLPSPSAYSGWYGTESSYNYPVYTSYGYNPQQSYNASQPQQQWSQNQNYPDYSQSSSSYFDAQYSAYYASYPNKDNQSAATSKFALQPGTAPRPPPPNPSGFSSSTGFSAPSTYTASSSYTPPTSYSYTFQQPKAASLQLPGPAYYVQQGTTEVSTQPSKPVTDTDQGSSYSAAYYASNQPRPSYAAALTNKTADQTVPQFNISSAASVAPPPRPKPPNPSRFKSIPQTPTAPPQPDAPKISSKGVVWPVSLSKFCDTAFDQCKTDADREIMQTYLKELLNKITRDGKLHSHNWENERIPTIETLSQVLEVMREPLGSAKPKRTRWKSATDSEDQETTELQKQEKRPKLQEVELTPHEFRMREQRQKRFQQNASNGNRGRKRHYAQIQLHETPTGIDWSQYIVKGTSETLEKDYLRLTSAPDPASVRPKAVLEKALQRLKDKWAQKEVEYLYMWSQLKAVRQDLTVQHIKDELTVQVYEYHARVALEEGDVNEYNQCQTQLKELYMNGIPGCVFEFAAYRILYYLLVLGNKKMEAASSDLMTLIGGLSAEARLDEGVAHALQMRTAVFDNNYRRCLTLYRSTPKHGLFIVEMFLDRIRVDALRRMVKAYRPTLDIEFVRNQLSLEDTAACMDYCGKCNIQFTSDGAIDTKASEKTFDPTALYTQDTSLL